MAHLNHGPKPESTSRTILTVRAPSERINLKDFTEQLSGHFD
jgi:hypothetical protein